MWYNRDSEKDGEEMRGRNRIDTKTETMVQAKETTNKLETLFAHAKARLVNFADEFLAGQRPVSALATA